MVLGHTLVMYARFCKGSQTVIMILSLPYSIIAFLQLFLCFVNCFPRWYDFQHEGTVFKITAAPGKTFPLKVEVMPTFRWCQYHNTLLYHIVVLEQESRTFIKKHVPVDSFVLTKDFSFSFIRSQLIDPKSTIY